MKEIRNWDEQTIRIQDKGSRFVILDNVDYEEKVQHQINRSSFEKIAENPNKTYEKRVNTWIEKWYSNKSISEKWKKFITVKDSTPGKMYGNVKTHKIGNPTRVITSGCNTAIENLSIFVENVLYDIASELPSRIKDTNHMLDIIDNLNSLDLPVNSILVSFDIINMFPNIDNNLGLSSVKKYLDLCSGNIPPTNCLLEALELCLSCNNSIFNNENYLQTDGTAQGPHMSCCYADIAMADFDKEASEYRLTPTTWKRFRDDIFVLWPHGRESLVLFLDYINTLDPTEKIKFTMEVAEPGNYLEFLDLKLKWESGKITVDVHSKPTNSFTYVLPTTCYPRKSINNIPHGIALRLRRICDSDEKFKQRSEEYKNYLIARDYHPGLVDKQFRKVEMTSRHNARKKNTKRKEVSKVKFITTFNPAIPSIEGLIRKHIHYLHADEVLKKAFPSNKFSVIYKRNKNLKEMVAPSLYPKPSIKSNHTIVSCNKCDICKNFLITDSKFRCTVTGKTYFIKGNLL